MILWMLQKGTDSRGSREKLVKWTSSNPFNPETVQQPSVEEVPAIGNESEQSAHDEGSVPIETDHAQQTVMEETVNLAQQYLM